MADTNRLRVQFDFSEEALRRLDALRETTEARTRADVVKRSLRLYEWFVEEFKDERDITVRRGSDGKETTMLVSLLI